MKELTAEALSQNQMDVHLVCEQLCQSLDVILNAKSSAIERQTATGLVEEFKSNPDVMLLIDVSLELLKSSFGDPDNLIVHKHFGLQVLEFVIKFHWNSIGQEVKQQMKNLMEDWFRLGLSLVSTEQTNWRHLVSGASRCVVEVLMREWPQNWPQFTSVLLTHQSYLSLYCIWQLADDIGICFRPNNGQRRREMTNEFNRNLRSIYEYISRCLTTNDTDLRQISVSTLIVMFEWTQFNADLLQVLINILTVDDNDVKSNQTKQLICDSLLVCLNRKQLKATDKTALQMLFTGNNMSALINTLR